MSELRMAIPNEANWPERTLDQMCVVISRGTAPVYVEHSDVMAIGQRCVSNSGFDGDKARPHSIRAMLGVLVPESGDVLLNSTGTGTIGRSCTFDHLGAYMVDGHVTLLRSKHGQFEGQWLDAVLRTSWGQNHLERFCYSGSTNQVELNRSQLATTQLPVPCIKEQRAISRVLDTLDTTIRQTEAIIAKLQQVKQGLLHDLLTRGIDANGQLRPPVEQAPHLYKESPLGWIPREWSCSQLQHLASQILDGTHYTPTYTEMGVPFLRVTDLHERIIDPKKTKYISSREHNILIKRCKPEIGDVLLSKNGTVGIAREIDWNWEFSIFVSLALIKIPHHSAITSGYLKNVINSRIIGRQILRRSKQGTVTNLHLEEIREFDIPFPTKQEQEIINSKLRAFQNKLDLEISELHKLKLNKSALMDDLLTGRVRVTALLAQVDANR